MRQPGVRLRALATALFDDRTMQRVVDPAIADLQRELSELRAARRIWKARLILLVGYGALLQVIALVASRQVWSMWNDASGDETRALRRTIAVFAIVTSAVSIALAIPHYYLYETPGRGLRVLYIIPSVLPLSIAVGVTAAIVAALATQRLTRKLVGAMIAAAVVCSTVLFADMAWIAPDANQAYRESAFGGPVVRGDRELGMSDLLRRIKLRPDEGRRFQITYHMRWSLSAAPLALAGLALAMLRIQRRPRRAVTIAGICVAYYALTMGAQGMAIWSMLPVIAILWMPNIALAALAAVLTWRAQPADAAAGSPRR